MRACFSSDREYVLFIPDPLRPNEKKALAELPLGIGKRDGSKYCPAKINVVHNLLTRIKARFGSALFVDRDLQDFVDAPFTLKAIPDTFKYFTTPLKHQEIALRYMYTVGGGGCLLDPGLGKTKVVLDYIALAEFKKSIIVCPKALLFVWEEEVKKHRPDKTCYVVQSTTWGIRLNNAKEKVFDETKERAAIVKEGKYEDVDARLEILKERFPAKKEKLVNKIQTQWDEDWGAAEAADIIVVNYDKMVAGHHWLGKLKPDFIAADEGLIKDPKTNRTKAITELSNKIPNRCIMSGTLVNNTPLDVFAPVRFMEPALTGTSYPKFRTRYCHLVQDKKTHRSFEVGFKDVHEVKDILDSCSIVMSKDEWLTLPDKKFEYINCKMSEEQSKHYYEMAANYITNVGGSFVEVDSPLTAMCKLSQISNGFIYTQTEPEDVFDLDGGCDSGAAKSTRETYLFKEQPKLDKFEEVYKEKLSDRKFIMWFNMSAEHDLITERLDRLGISYLVIRGGEKNTGGKVDSFNKDPSIQILLCQARSVNYGITVLGTSMEALEKSGVEVPKDIDTQVYTQVFYSLNYSLELFLQQQDRCHRIGQDKEVEYYILVADSPSDQAIPEKLEAKMSIRGQILIDIMHKIKEGLNAKSS